MISGCKIWFHSQDSYTLTNDKDYANTPQIHFENGIAHDLKAQHMFLAEETVRKPEKYG
jgi:hypothetical protein